MREPTAYVRLEGVFRKVSLLGDTLSVLHWDMSAMMPEGGANARAEQLALLKTLAHEAVTAPEISDLLAQAEGEELDAWQRANLREMRRDWVHAAAVPADLVEALSKAEAACEMAWRQARPAADFAMALPSLREVLSLVRESGQAKSEALGVSVYDSLLDQYEPDGRSADMDAVFADLEGFLPDFIVQAEEAQARRPAPRLPAGPFPEERQRALGLEMMKALGFDFNHWRLDTSFHPFCGGYPEDVRITTRYDQEDFTSAMMGVLHETGHALYDFGLPGGKWRYQPVGRARGMQMHESQSLLIEMQACRSREFLSFAAPKMRAAFGAGGGSAASGSGLLNAASGSGVLNAASGHGDVNGGFGNGAKHSGSGSDWDVENLYRLGLKVERGFIRVDADEVTYPAHVIIRYRLERALIEGRMDLADLPEAWNQGYRDLLGITPPDHRLGCLQDIHWYGGAWGYFPTYTLGAMTAAQLFAAAAQADSAISPAIAQGDFAPLLAWLRAHVHGLGSSLSTRDLLIKATGRPLDASVFKAHLANRYLA